MAVGQRIGRAGPGMSPPGSACRRHYRFTRLAGLAGALALLLGGGALAGEGLLIKGKAVLAQQLLERAFARQVAGDADARGWWYADVTPVARLIGPDGDHDIVLSGVSGEAMAFGPGHMAGTPYPGEPGLSVLAAHRDTHFRYLETIRIGDVIKVDVRNGERIAFRIVETRIVHADASGLEPLGGPARLALVTCYPFNAVRSAPWRFVAIGERISADSTV